MRLPAVPVLPSKWLRPLIALLALQSTQRIGRRCLRRVRAVSSKERQSAVAELKRLVPPVPPEMLGGEKMDSSVYARFLSVCQWSPEKAAERLEKDIVWRQKYKPRLLRPSDCPTLCRQSSWRVLMVPRSGLGSLLGMTHNATGPGGDERMALGSRFFSRVGSADGVVGSSIFSSRKPLHPPHLRPTMYQWRYTRQGMPITFFRCAEWRPDKAPRDERIRCVAYHVSTTVGLEPILERRIGPAFECSNPDASNPTVPRVRSSSSFLCRWSTTFAVCPIRACSACAS